MTNWKYILFLIIVAILSLAAIDFYVGVASAADNLTVNITPTINITPTKTATQIPLYNTVTPTPSPTPKVKAVMANGTAPNGSIPIYVYQGDTVYLGDTVDVSGVMAGVLNFAYYGGYGELDGDQYLLD
jgi:hypothetical protein